MGIKVFIRKLVAQNKNEMGTKPIDVYTVSHVLMGIVSYIVFFLFLRPFFLLVDTMYVSLISVLFWAIIWEYVENFILIKTRIKFGSRQDSLENSLTDVVFTGLGGIIAFYSREYVWIVLVVFLLMILYNWAYYKHAMG